MVPVVRLKFFQKYLTEMVKYGIFKILINLTKIVGYKDVYMKQLRVGGNNT